MAMDSVKNFAKGTLSVGIDSSATSIVLTAGHGAKFPAPSTDGAFNAVIWNATDYDDPADDPTVEIVRCTARSSDTLTVTRAQEGTSAAAHNTSGKTYKIILGLTKKMMQDLGEWAHGIVPSGTINGINTAFTLPDAPSPASSLILHLNGIYQTAGGEDYSLSGSTITYVSPPLTGWKHVAHYQKLPAWAS